MRNRQYLDAERGPWWAIGWFGYWIGVGVTLTFDPLVLTFTLPFLELSLGYERPAADA